MSAPNESWPRIASALFYEDGAAAIDYLCRCFGFEVRMKVVGEGGRIEHSELTLGDGLVMVGSVDRTDKQDRDWCETPKRLGGKNTQSLCVLVDDVDQHCGRARAAGAEIATEPATQDYGDEYGAHRTYQVRDLEGHRWWFMQQLRGPKV